MAGPDANADGEMTTDPKAARDRRAQLSRRSMLGFGSVVAGGAALAGLDHGAAQAAPHRRPGHDHPHHHLGHHGGVGSLPVATVEKIIGAQGQVSDGVLNIEVDRDDITGVVNSHGVPIKPSFQVNANVVFQSAHGWSSDYSGGALLNGDLPFRESELQPALDQMLAHGLVFQAMHQHFYDWNPMVWFMHFRGQGDPVQLAKGVRAVLDATSTPLPQSPPANPTTPLDSQRLASIIGASPTVGADGVVTFEVPRQEPIMLGERAINPYLNVSTTIAFEPLASSTAVVPDFGMVAHEIDRLVSHMRSLGWQVGCLYNQETDEYPQLYFSHQFKAGDPYMLAREVRSGLDLMNVDTSNG